jgi:ubiquinone/menaquinone biosynthesis C-methylase UbiE
MALLKTEYDIDDPDVVSAIDDLPLWSAPFGMKLLEVVTLRKNIRALDIGSGLGFPVIELSQRLGPTCQVYGIDPWTAAVDRARLKIRTWHISNLEILEGHAESLPFQDNYFGLVISNNGTNNVDDEEQCYAEIGRVAERGAQVVLTMNLPDTMLEFYSTYRDVLRRYGKHEEVEKLDAHILEKRKPLAHTRALIERAGLELLQVHEGSFSLRYADGTAMLNHFTIKLAFLAPWIRILQPDDVTPLMADLERELNAIAERDGELSLAVPWVCLDCRKQR